MSKYCCGTHLALLLFINTLPERGLTGRSPKDNEMSSKTDNNSNTITCPECKTPIPISEALMAQASQLIRAEMEAELTESRAKLKADRDKIEAERKQIEKQAEDVQAAAQKAVEAERAKLEAKAKKQAEEAIAVELKDRDEQLAESKQKLKAAQDKEVEMRKRERALDEQAEAIKAQQEELEAKAMEKLDAEREKLIKQTKEAAAKDAAEELAERDKQLADFEAKLKKSRDEQTELLKKQRELNERAESLELEVARKLDEERSAIRDQALKQAAEAQSLKDAEKDKKMADLMKQIDEMKRKAEQGSQQTQGEVLEIALEAMLKDKFPHDSIEEVPKGVNGGDTFHRVSSGGVADCGTILWESKRTKAWSAGWLTKLRKDQRDAKADIAVLVSTVMPEGVNTFAQIDGVWVCSWECASVLAAVLRVGVIEVSKARRSAEGQESKKDHVYNYLAGPEFRNRVQGIVEAFASMQDELAKEKRSTQRQWAKREKLNELAVANTVGMYGDLQGIIGASLPEIEGMEMPGLESSEQELPAIGASE